MARRKRPRQPDVFVDRSLGSKQLPDALREVGLVVHTLASLYGEEGAQQVPDEEWLERVGREGWIVLAKDTRIRRRSHELRALIDHDVRAFVLTSGNLTGDEQVARILAQRHRILQCAAHPGPYMYGIYADGIRRLFPPKG